MLEEERWGSHGKAELAYRYGVVAWVSAWHGWNFVENGSLCSVGSTNRFAEHHMVEHPADPQSGDMSNSFKG